MKTLGNVVSQMGADTRALRSELTESSIHMKRIKESARRARAGMMALVGVGLGPKETSDKKGAP